MDCKRQPVHVQPRSVFVYACFARVDEGGTAVEQAIKASSLKDPEAAYQAYIEAVAGKSNSEAREIAKDILGKSVYWDWDCTHSSLIAWNVGINQVPPLVPKTKEGYYHYTGGVEVRIPSSHLGLACFTFSYRLLGCDQAHHDVRALRGLALA